MGGRGVCVGGRGVYPEQVILRPAHTHTDTERECIFMYVHGYIPGHYIDYTY